MVQNVLHTLLILVLTSSFNLFAQLDKTSGANSKGTSIGKIEAPAREVKKPQSLDFENTNGFKTANADLEKKRRKKQAEDDLVNKGIITPAMLRKMTLKKQAERYNTDLPVIDKDLGSFTTKSASIKVRAFDFGQLDGDVISIFVNGEPVVTNQTLKQYQTTYEIPLKIGFNKIEILAVHEGYLRPNTGGFTVFDTNDSVVVSDLWNLAQGAKVIAHVIREK
ncbi:hypothetical protein [Tenacibaculum agarivorans]|uniref:hypothetical protein n=1 Tax=Tenacibaculum agarivorans TaxID=1908389 RepID=UPI00094BC4FC|nr:hypothetical protein [Tenacibaculum agarivorans]